MNDGEFAKLLIVLLNIAFIIILVMGFGNDVEKIRIIGGIIVYFVGLFGLFMCYYTSKRLEK